MPTITVSRQMGSFGYAAAKITAEKLGYRLVWREVINQAAHIAGSPEAALAAIDELGLLGLSPEPKQAAAYRRGVESVMHELAAEGNVVIVGRAGQVILKHHPDTLHVRIIAPSEVRASRIAAIHNIALEYAYEQIRASDEARRRYIRRYYHQPWNDPDLYDLILNTARLSPEITAEVIVTAAQLLEKVSTPTS